MSVYRRVEIKMWNDETFKNLSPLQPSGQALWIYLLTGPHTGSIPGLSRAGRAQLAEDLNWTQEAFDHAMSEVIAEGLAYADWDAKIVWIPNAIKYNLPASVNVVKSWEYGLDKLTECELLRQAIAHILEALKNYSESYFLAAQEVFSPLTKDMSKVKARAMPKDMAKPMPTPLPCAIHEHEHKHKQDQDKEGDFNTFDSEIKPIEPISPQPSYRKSTLDARLAVIAESWKLHADLPRYVCKISATMKADMITAIDAVLQAYTDAEIITAIDNYAAARNTIEPKYQYQSFHNFIANPGAIAKYQEAVPVKKEPSKWVWPHIECCGEIIQQYRPFCLKCGKEFDAAGNPK